jgi:hypothetical protein
MSPIIGKLEPVPSKYATTWIVRGTTVTSSPKVPTPLAARLAFPLALTAYLGLDAELGLWLQTAASIRLCRSPKFAEPRSAKLIAAKGVGTPVERITTYELRDNRRALATARLRTGSIPLLSTPIVALPI